MLALHDVHSPRIFSAKDMGDRRSSLPPRGPRGRRRDTIHSVDDQWFFYADYIISWVASTMEQLGPSILDKSPEEHDRDAIIARNKMSYQMKHFYQRAPTPPGHARIHFFASLEMLRQAERKPSLIAEVPLEPTGELDLNRVKKLWGLETCAPVDPMRWKVFEPISDRLSPLAVYTLSQRNQAIQVIEPHVSPMTQRKRAIRIALVPVCLWLMGIYHLAVVRGERFLRQHTNIIESYEESLRLRRVFAWRVEQWVFEHHDLFRMLFAFVLMALILFITSVAGGYVNLSFVDYSTRLGVVEGMASSYF